MLSGWERRAIYKRKLLITMILSNQCRVRVGGHEIGHCGVNWWDEDSVDHMHRRKYTPNGQPNQKREYDGCTFTTGSKRNKRSELKNNLIMTVATKVAEEILMNKPIGHVADKEWYEDEEAEWNGKDEEDAEEEGEDDVGWKKVIMKVSFRL
ncbi:hypothetical protein niasHS_014341 [Heterodera schachtii]|uniref:Uncharacterized protein n=1 Tax=Heterodera schachtii TaxID=97005 RepID=A0ABD2I6X6_HETSC